MSLEPKLPTDFLVSAHIRQANRDGVPMVVVRRGDAHSGAIVLKIDRLDGTAHVLLQVRFDHELVWTPATATDPMPLAEAELLFQQQAAFDPDLWLIEIEDRQGRHWFPGQRL